MLFALTLKPSSLVISNRRCGWFMYVLFLYLGTGASSSELKPVELNESIINMLPYNMSFKANILTKKYTILEKMAMVPSYRNCDCPLAIPTTINRCVTTFIYQPLIYLHSFLRCS